MKPSIFFFPEFPEEALEPGDDFDSIIRFEMPGMMGMGGMKSITKLTYTLEDISDGFATFSIRGWETFSITSSAFAFNSCDALDSEEY